MGYRCGFFEVSPEWLEVAMRFLRESPETFERLDRAIMEGDEPDDRDEYR